MAAPRPRNANVQLMACLLDDDDTDDSDYRFLVDGKHVKYLITAPGIFRGAKEDRCFEPILLGELLPPFPTGSWNKGFVARDTETDEVSFVKTETECLAGVENLWHPATLNELDFTKQDRVRQRVHVATHPMLNNSKPVLIKLAVWPWEIRSIEIETTAYQQINGSGIGPKFLGHLSEGKDGRVVGFVVEWMQGARAAGPGDMKGCEKTLGRLHGLGIKLGDINKHNFLVRDGHDVVLVDFESAKRNCLPDELNREMSALKGNLEDAGSRGGVDRILEQ